MRDPKAALARHRAQVSADKRAAVIAACGQLESQVQLITISDVAKAAGVSREFIHSHADLHARVTAAVARARSNWDSEWSTNPGSVSRMGTAERTTLINALTRSKLAKEKLEAKVAELQAQRRRELGAKLEALDQPSPTQHRADAALLERTQAENARVTRELAEATTLIVQLTEDLAAARLALSDALAPQMRKLRPLRNDADRG